MKLATTTGDFFPYTTSHLEAVSLCAEAGFSYLDYSFGADYSRQDGCFSSDLEGYLDRLIGLAREQSVTFVQAHAPMGAPIARGESYEPFIEMNKSAIACCGRLGIPNIVIHSGYESGLTKEETFERNRDFYLALTETAEQYNVNILTENFNLMCVPELYWIDNAEDTRALIDYIDHPRIHACWDTGHGNMNERSQDESLRVLGEHVYALHVQDNLGDDDHHFAPFFGTMNPDSLMHGLSEIGYQGFFTFEANNLMTFEGSRKTYDADTRLMNPPLSLKLQAEKLLYGIGKYILETYDCFEE